MEPSIESEDGGTESYLVSGEWTADYAAKCFKETEALRPGKNAPVIIKGGTIENLDTTGAWILNRKINALMQSGLAVSLEGFKAEHLRFIKHIGELCKNINGKPPQKTFTEILEKKLQEHAKTLKDGLAFLGYCLVTIAKTLRRPRKFRISSFIKQCEMAGVRACPIVGLISFLIAIVLAYQGSAQLKRFGAEIYSINLVTISVLREMGVLLTAIMLAGRSGSAFAAEIGTMKLNEEIDALKTTGLNPMQVLVLPRILALMVMTPLLAFLADITGLIGSGVLTVSTSDTNWQLYQSRLIIAIRPGDFWIGIIKAPVFGFLIGMVGCFHGMKVANSAESVGKETTAAVVTSIFMVMLADALFSIVFTVLGI